MTHHVTVPWVYDSSRIKVENVILSEPDLTSNNLPPLLFFNRSQKVLSVFNGRLDRTVKYEQQAVRPLFTGHACYAGSRSGPHEQLTQWPVQLTLLHLHILNSSY